MKLTALMPRLSGQIEAKSESLIFPSSVACPEAGNLLPEDQTRFTLKAKQISVCIVLPLGVHFRLSNNIHLYIRCRVD